MTGGVHASMVDFVLIALFAVGTVAAAVGGLRGATMPICTSVRRPQGCGSQGPDGRAVWGWESGPASGAAHRLARHCGLVQREFMPPDFANRELTASFTDGYS